MTHGSFAPNETNVSILDNEVRTGRIRFLIACSFTVLVSSVIAQGAARTCAAVEVHSVNVSYELAQNGLFNEKSDTIEVNPVAGSKDATIVIRGPILGSMDSTKIRTGLSCTTAGLTLTATISRSEYYNGVAAQNRIWLAKINMVITPRAPDVVFEAIWEMEMTNGKEVDRAQTPPYPEQNYPIILTKTMHFAAKK